MPARSSQHPAPLRPTARARAPFLASALLPILLAILLAAPRAAPAADANQAAATAAPFSLAMPLTCDYGHNCFIQNYFDTDPGKDFHDFACGTLSYDGHTGTDFYVLPAIYRRGVPVLAAADGVVRAVRDDMPDVNVRISGAAVKGREAGNAVAVRHPGGWETRYNHLRRGSVTVHPGDRVRAGQVLGLVGLSGQTEFPHLELIVERDAVPVCPFTGLDGSTGCNAPGAAPLWDAETARTVRYIATAAIGAGFEDRAFEATDARTGFTDKPEFQPSAEAVVFWATMIGVRKGDVEELTLRAPDGTVIAHQRNVVERNQVRRMRLIGRRLPEGGHWPAGEYVGEYAVLRGADPTPAATIRAGALMR